jgi:REP element-mobilizing transposase RayT
MKTPLPQRKLQRLKNYPYDKNGAYFLTVCAQNKRHLFGKIINNEMLLNKAGDMVKQQLENIFYDKNSELMCYAVMPNHIHLIAFLFDENINVSDLVRDFKGVTTNFYIIGVKSGEYPPFDKKIWQKSFYDRIIRSEIECLSIADYIETNPQNWSKDELLL